MILARTYEKNHTLSLYQILKVGAFIYFIDRTADMVRDVLVLEVESKKKYTGINETRAIDYGYSCGCCQVYFAIRRRMKTRRGRKC